jgi:blue copper oxidase
MIAMKGATESKSMDDENHDSPDEAGDPGPDAASHLPASRRHVLSGGVAAAVWLGAGARRPLLAAGKPGAAPAPAPRDTKAAPAVELSLRARPAEAVLDAARAPAKIWRFDGKLLAGRAGAVLTSPGYLGPTLRVRRGDRVRVRFDNALDEPTIVHWHGLRVAQENDGHPRFAVKPGGSYLYDFTVENRPGLYWYHPHPDGRTGPQVYAGMAGLFIVVDPDDAARGLPTEERDLALVIQDRSLGDGGELVYAANPMLGVLGDRIFVNGVETPVFSVDAGSYRLRLLNGSNARIYKLAFSDGSPMTVIGTDGGLLAAPVKKPYVALAPGERVELWADFGRAPGGGDVWLESQAFSAGGGMMGMRGMGGMGRSPGLANGAPLRVCRFEVRGKGPRLKLPARFEPLAFRPDKEVVNGGRPRRFEISMAMMRWQLNGRSFQMTEVAANERVKLETTEDWELVNPGGMMAMAHPIHLHAGQFQVVERSRAPGMAGAAETLRAGLVDEGWKDTVLVFPGERARIRMRFERYPGLFLYHCHNLEHEDAGMMRNFLIEA